jgi:hypothetical protein
MESIEQNRPIYLLESILATISMFILPNKIESETMSTLVLRLSSYMLAFKCGHAALGYARCYLNFNTPFGKIANEVIFHMYL